MPGETAKRRSPSAPLRIARFGQQKSYCFANSAGRPGCEWYPRLLSAPGGDRRQLLAQSTTITTARPGVCASRSSRVALSRNSRPERRAQRSARPRMRSASERSRSEAESLAECEHDDTIGPAIGPGQLVPPVCGSAPTTTSVVESRVGPASSFFPSPCALRAKRGVGGNERRDAEPRGRR
jgi:hypothetical protein